MITRTGSLLLSFSQAAAPFESAFLLGSFELRDCSRVNQAEIDLVKLQRMQG